MQAFAKSVLISGIAACSIAAWPLSNDSKKLPRVVEYYKNWFNTTCYADLYGDDRLLPNRTDPPLNTSTMTVEACLDFCDSQGSIFAGIEYGRDCYCGNKRPHWYWIGDRDDCDYACSGNPTQICGGSQHLLVYERPPNKSHP